MFSSTHSIIWHTHNTHNYKVSEHTMIDTSHIFDEEEWWMCRDGLHYFLYCLYSEGLVEFIQKKYPGTSYEKAEAEFLKPRYTRKELDEVDQAGQTFLRLALIFLCRNVITVFSFCVESTSYDKSQFLNCSKPWHGPLLSISAC